MSDIPTNPGPPGGKERRSRNRMPDTDWLTGLSSRAAFARQVAQADQDRDQFAVAIIGLGHIDEINRHVGFATGDDLLRLVGRALADQVGVGTTAARLGGAQFGLMTVGPKSENVGDWIEPVVSTLGAVIDRWILDQIDFNGSCPIEPRLMVGASGGYSGRVWADAAIALDVCEKDASGRGEQVAIHDQTDRRFSAIRASEQTNDDVEVGLQDNSLRVLYRAIEPTQEPADRHRWYRIAAATEAEPDAEIDLSILRNTLGRRLERHLITAAMVTIQGEEEPLTITAPIDWNLRSGAGPDYWLTGSSVGGAVPTDRLLFECSESVVIEAGAVAYSLLAELTSTGFGIVLAECTGGANTIAILDAVPIRHLKPRVDLLTMADRGNRAALSVMDVLVTMADGAGDGALILPNRTGSATTGRWAPSPTGYRFVEGPTLANPGHRAAAPRPA